MTFIKLASFFLITALSLKDMKAAQEELFLAQNNDKEGAKTLEKRMDNFRVPVDASFDLNFWPARGRRGRIIEGRPHGENFIPTDDNFSNVKEGCQDDNPKAKKSKVIDLEEHPYTGSEFLMKENCSNLIKRLVHEVWECRSKWKILDTSGKMFPGGSLDSQRHKKLRYYELPDDLWLYGADVLWRPDLSYREKEKKQDVFWVTRGKKSFN